MCFICILNDNACFRLFEYVCFAVIFILDWHVVSSKNILPFVITLAVFLEFDGNKLILFRLILLNSEHLVECHLCLVAFLCIIQGHQGLLLNNYILVKAPLGSCHHSLLDIHSNSKFCLVCGLGLPPIS